MTLRLIPWKVWFMWGLLTAAGLGVLVLGARAAIGQATPPPCDEVVLTLHRQLAEQVQDQLLRELAAARRALAVRPAAPTEK